MNLRRMVEFNFLRQLSKERKEDDSGLVSRVLKKKIFIQGHNFGSSCFYSCTYLTYL